jgi:hypothetical protein
VTAASREMTCSKDHDRLNRLSLASAAHSAASRRNPSSVRVIRCFPHTSFAKRLCRRSRHLRSRQHVISSYAIGQARCFPFLVDASCTNDPRSFRFSAIRVCGDTSFRSGSRSLFIRVCGDVCSHWTVSFYGRPEGTKVGGLGFARRIGLFVRTNSLLAVYFNFILPKSHALYGESLC